MNLSSVIVFQIDVDGIAFDPTTFVERKGN
jgi:hypothetical protein